MAQPMFDAESLIAMYENATTRQGEQLRRATAEATLAALRGRELTLRNIKAALKSVSGAASLGAAKNPMAAGGMLDPQMLLDKAVAGMDDAMLKTVQANHKALSMLAAQGADLRDKHLAKAMADLDRFEDTMFAALRTTAAGVGAPLAGAWGAVLERMKAGGTVSGVQASLTSEQLTEQLHGAMRSTRAASMRAAQALAESYTALVSGVLMGLSDAMQPAAQPEKPPRKRA